VVCVSEKYPWFKKYESSFSDSFAPQERSLLKSSLLLSAPLGLGFIEFVKEKVQQCLPHSGNLFWLAPEAESSVIKIEQIRALIDFMRLKTFSGTYRLAVIENAELMNLNAQNALLKTLEEPAEHAFIWLLSSHPRRLLPTILSRCQRFSFCANASEAQAYFHQEFPSEDPKQLWERCHFGPLTISVEHQVMRQAWIQDLKAKASPLRFARNFLKTEQPSDCLFDFFYEWTLDWYRTHMGLPANFFRGEESWFESYAFSFARRQKLKAFSKKMIQLKKAKLAGIMLNQELLLEDLLIEWTQL